MQQKYYRYTQQQKDTDTDNGKQRGQTTTQTKSLTNNANKEKQQRKATTQQRNNKQKQRQQQKRHNRRSDALTRLHFVLCFVDSIAFSICLSHRVFSLLFSSVPSLVCSVPASCFLLSRWCVRFVFCSVVCLCLSVCCSFRFLSFLVRFFFRSPVASASSCVGQLFWSLS